MNDTPPRTHAQRINLNDEATVRLTAYGKNLYLEFHRKLGVPAKAPDVLTEQLWSIMAIFGGAMFMGNPKIPFVDNEITLPSPSPASEPPREELNDVQATRGHDRSDELRLQAALVKIRKILETAVCTVGCDKGVVTLSQDGPTHPEAMPCPECIGKGGHWNGVGIPRQDWDCGRCGGTGSVTVQCYDHEFFSPLGDALVEAWTVACKAACEQPTPPPPSSLPATSPVAGGEPPEVRSRSVQRREATQRGEPMPVFSKPGLEPDAAPFDLPSRDECMEMLNSCKATAPLANCLCGAKAEERGMKIYCSGTCRIIIQGGSESEARELWNTAMSARTFVPAIIRAYLRLLSEKQAVEQSHSNSVTEERRLRALHQYEFSRAEKLIEYLEASIIEQGTGSTRHWTREEIEMKVRKDLTP